MPGFTSKIITTGHKNISIYVRIYPCVNDNDKYVKIENDKKTILVKCLQDWSYSYPNADFYWKFNTDGILYNADQNTVYNTIVGDTIEHAINGHSTVFVSYGQTGTGKSFTINGLRCNFQQRGIIPRFIPNLLEMKREMKDLCSVKIGMSYIETRGTEFFDLLNENPDSIPVTQRYNRFKNIKVFNVYNESTAMELLFEGEGRRNVEKNCPYKNSHKYSSVVTFYIVSTSVVKTNAIETLAKIHFIDMVSADSVGNETCFWKQNVDVSLGNINKSQLELFILALKQAQKTKTKLSYSKRASLLAGYISDCFHSKTVLRFICHISNEHDRLPVTISMLRFAQQISGLNPERVEYKARNINDFELENLRISLDECTKEAFRSSLFSDIELSAYVTQSRLEHLMRVANAYLENEISDMALINVSHCTTVLKLLKDMYTTVKQDAEVRVQNAYNKGVEEGLKQSKAVSTLPASGKGASAKAAPVKSVAGTGKDTKSGKTAPSTIAEDTSRASKISLLPQTVGDYSKSSGQGIGPGVGTSYASSLVQRKSTGESQVESTQQDLTSMPSYEEAWTTFLSQTPNANKLNETLTVLQNNLEETRRNYSEEVAQLYSLRSELESQNNELMKAQMKRHLAKMEEYNSDGLIIPSQDEKRLRLSIVVTESAIRTKEDIIFVYQSDLKSFMDQIPTLKKDLDEQFQSFCAQTYKMAIAEVNGDEVPSQVVALNIIAEDTNDIEEEENRLHVSYQRKMAKVAKEKVRMDAIKSQKWV